MDSNTTQIAKPLISAAPMMDISNRHWRYFMRLISRYLILYTEMITAKALLYGKHDDLLASSSAEQPVVLQIGGSEPDEMALAAERGARAGYREININVGCPSPRVQSGAFGACLMREPATVAACIKAMHAASGLPITVKTRLGVDDDDNEAFLHRFIEGIAAAGCGHVLIHARKAILNGLNPKENRTIPPLQYDRALRVKAAFPHLRVTLNGGIKTIDDVLKHGKCFDGVMIGRAMNDHPYQWNALDSLVFSDSTPPLTRGQIARHYLDYANEQAKRGARWSMLLKPLLMLYAGQPHGRAWRQRLSTASTEPDPLPSLTHMVNELA